MMFLIKYAWLTLLLGAAVIFSYAMLMKPHAQPDYVYRSADHNIGTFP
jgi:hypothetical protein